MPAGTGRRLGGSRPVATASWRSRARAWLGGLSKIAPPGPVLDVGCGDGALLRALRARGRQAVGLERVAVGDGVLAVEISDFNERAGEWAAVIFWHSLEHLRDPAAAVDRACALLAPHGVLLIAVPNLDSWQARWFGDRWFHLRSAAASVCTCRRPLCGPACMRAVCRCSGAVTGAPGKSCSDGCTAWWVRFRATRISTARFADPTPRARQSPVAAEPRCWLRGRRSLLSQSP